MLKFNRKPAAGRDVSRLTLKLWDFTGTALLNLFMFIFIIAFLSPLAFMVVSSVTPHEQFSDSFAPIYPVRRVEFQYEGRTLTLYNVPTEDGMKQWALAKPLRQYSEFIDPQNPEAGRIRWEGSWRMLEPVYIFSPTLDNFRSFLEFIDLPLLLSNTMAVALISEAGVLISSIMVAYGFSRFRIPGGKYLFMLVIATIMIPSNITLVPTYFLFSGRALDWIGTWLPLIVPHLFGSAILIFLLRQNFKSIPRDLDEAAMLDGAGPMRILLMVILPQSIPTVVTVALLHFFYAWNETRNAGLYLGTAPDLQTISLSVQVNQSLFPTPEILMVGAMILMIVPITVLFLSQRFFMQDMVVTQLEK